ncbi:hypothetical protein KC356_g348 [Hortaea werneckii]|nr:hypothetical protein KC356_g348 [Hortaea werneckii]
MLTKLVSTNCKIGTIPSLITMSTRMTHFIKNSFSCTFSGLASAVMSLNRCCNKSFDNGGSVHCDSRVRVDHVAACHCCAFRMLRKSLRQCACRQPLRCDGRVKMHSSVLGLPVALLVLCVFA